MKVIDLINDLFDYREFQPDKLPKKIRFNNEEFVFKSNSYYNENGINIMRYVDHTLDLRVEVEIIEEVEVLEEDKEIEELDMRYSDELEEYVVQTYINGNYYTEVYNSRYDEMIINKINELIRNQKKIINELKKGK